MAGRNIVICLDGTQNRFGDSETNVLRLYRMAARDPATQLTYYQPGVGTITPDAVLGRARAFALRALDSATAWMLERHVRAAYRFLMTTWQPDDRLFVFGFSRGAFAARVLCGMLNKVGLLHAGMDEMIPFAWREYRRERSFARAATFRKIFSRRLRVHFLGLWDTVSSVGTPWRPKRFDYTARNREVDTIRHAIALDERRALYAQNQWSLREIRRQDIREVWFAGVHSDVGGGYRRGEDALAFIPLAWMVDEARAAGLVIDEAIATRLYASLDDEQPYTAGETLARVTARHSGATMHDSLSGAWRALEWLPIPRWHPQPDGTFVRRWRWHGGAARALREGALVHESVSLRRLDPSLRYRATNVPESARFVSR